LDGQHTSGDAALELTALVASGQLTAQKDGVTVTDRRQVEELMLQSLNHQVGQFGRWSLLMA
jgi:hypothetical protein